MGWLRGGEVQRFSDYRRGKIMSRGKRKTMEGVVTSNKMNKTAVVRVERLVQHPVYKKTIKKFTKFKVHDEENICKLGDKVRIMETRPLSRDKRWRIVEVIK